MFASMQWFMGFKRRLGLTTLLCLFLGACSEAPEDQKDAAEKAPPQVTWRMALEEVEGSVQDIYAKEFKRRIEEESGGQIKLEVYPYGALGTSSQLTELVQGGALELAFASPGHLASVIPEVGVFTLHFVLSDDNEINQQVLASDQVQSILNEPYQKQGLELLSIVPEGWMVWTADKPLTSPADFKGFKIRTMTSPIVIKSYEAYGANPTPLPYSEVYSGLQLGQIDGQVNPVFAIEEMSFYEEQDVMTLANHAQFVSTLVSGKQWYQSLSAAQRAMIDAVTHDMVGWIYDKQHELNQQRLEKITNAGGTEVVKITDEQRAVFREASQSAHQVYIEQAGERGERLLNTIKQLVRELESQQSTETAQQDTP